MALVMRNFVSTALRAPISPSDTVLQLTTGAGAFFNIPAGSYCYLTINTATTAEIVKYTSVGTVLNDSITVVRGQDGTTAQSFPSGACISEGWNVEQVREFTQQLIDTTPTPHNTFVVTSTPVAPPAVNVYYAINVTTGQLWYWNGLVWTKVTSNNVLQVNRNPLDSPMIVPADGVVWAVNTATGSLYYWLGSTWQAITVTNTGGVLECHSRRYLNSPSGYSLAPGEYSFSELAQAPYSLVFTVIQDYVGNPAATPVIDIPTVGGDAYKQRVFASGLFQLDASVIGTVATPASAMEAYLTLTHTEGVWAFGTSLNRPAASAQTSVFMQLSSGVVYIPIAGPATPDVWDANLTIVGPSNLVLTQAVITISMFNLLA